MVDKAPTLFTSSIHLAIKSAGILEERTAGWLDFPPRGAAKNWASLDLRLPGTWRACTCCKTSGSDCRAHKRWDCLTTFCQWLTQTGHSGAVTHRNWFWGTLSFGGGLSDQNPFFCVCVHVVSMQWKNLKSNWNLRPTTEQCWGCPPSKTSHKVDEKRSKWC